MRKWIVLFSLALVTLGLESFQQDFNTVAKTQSLFIYNFASRYIEWPESYKEGGFSIGVLGESPLTNFLNDLASTKKVVNQSIEVKKYSGLSEITKCHILIVPKDRQESIGDIMNKVKNHATLIITEKEGAVKQGSVINFVIVENRQKFEINKTAIEKQELKVSSQLLPLATQVL